ncbi:hypothetical protein [Exiguobacterium sp. TNDT2]|uniref:hypothetical protein n=1 Tax=Exiguobacterium sp. TNDT2 TaxID=2233531 RepID=UPI0018E524BD|nr:hypothetical protein [Exiguobacterium sp. TNDT2]
MNRSYVLVLLAVFALFFLQLYAKGEAYSTPVSVVLVILIIGATLLQLRRKPNR